MTAETIPGVYFDVLQQAYLFEAQERYDADAQVYYVPFVALDGHVGYVVRSNDDQRREQREGFVYLNASGGSDDCQPSVFVYQGLGGNPEEDLPECYINVNGISYVEPVAS